MTKVDFHLNVAHKIKYASKIIQKARAQNLKVLVLAATPELRQLDHFLWSEPADGFAPHCLSNAPLTTLQRTDVILTELVTIEQHTKSDVLLNLSAQVTENYEQFQRVIEIVSQQEEDLQLARKRWSFYKSKGLLLELHNRL